MQMMHELVHIAQITTLQIINGRYQNWHQADVKRDGEKQTLHTAAG